MSFFSFNGNEMYYEIVSSNENDVGVYYLQLRGALNDAQKTVHKANWILTVKSATSDLALVNTNSNPELVSEPEDSTINSGDKWEFKLSYTDS